MIKVFIDKLKSTKILRVLLLFNTRAVYTVKLNNYEQLRNRN